MRDSAGADNQREAALGYAPSSVRQAGAGRRAAQLFTKTWRTFTGKALLLVLFLIVLVLLAGAIVWGVLDDFSSYPTSLWWAVEHLLDPSQIGEDGKGVGERAIGVVLVIVGLVVVLGVIFDGFAGAVDRSVKRADETDTSLDATGHILFIGWSQSLPDLIGDLGLHFAGRHRHSQIVVLVPNALRSERSAIMAQLRQASTGRPPQAVFGELDTASGLSLASAQSARTIVVHAADPRDNDPMAVDVETTKIALGLRRYLDRTCDGYRLPTVLVEFMSSSAAGAAYHLMPDTFLPIIWDRLMSALTALALTGTDWGIALFRLIGFGTEPSGLHVIDADELAGSAFEDAGTRLDTGVPIGIIRVFGSDSPTPRNTHAIVAPAIGTAIESGDQIVVAADRHPGIVAPNKARPPARPTALTDFEAIEPPASRILLIGLSPRLMTLERLASYKQGTAHVVILCPDEEQVTKAGIPNEIVERLGISVWRGDPLNESDLRSALRDVNPDRILLASTYPYDDMRLADAETLLTLFRLRRLTTAETLVHLHFPEDVGSLANDPTLDIIPTTAVRARLLAEAAINFGYLRVYHAIASRAYIHARTVTFHPADGEEHDFATVYRAALENDCVVVGISTGTAPDGRPGVNVAPTPDTTVAPGDLLLVALSNAGEDENAVLESLHSEGVVEKIELEMPGVGSARDTASGE